MGKDYFKYLSQELDSELLGLVKQKGFYPYEYPSGFEKYKEELSSNEKFYRLLRGKKISDKQYEHVLKVWGRFEMIAIKFYHDLHLNEIWRFNVNWCVSKF